MRIAALASEQPGHDTVAPRNGAGAGATATDDRTLLPSKQR